MAPLIIERSTPLTPPSVRVSYLAVRNPSSWPLFTPAKTILYFINGLRIFWGIGHPSTNIYAPIFISKRTAFSPSLLVRPLLLWVARLRQVLWPLLTSWRIENESIPRPASVRQIPSNWFLLNLLCRLFSINWDFGLRKDVLTYPT